MSRLFYDLILTVFVVLMCEYFMSVCDVEIKFLYCKKSVSIESVEVSPSTNSTTQFTESCAYAFCRRL